jgi:hypothetical protein
VDVELLHEMFAMFLDGLRADAKFGGILSYRTTARNSF